MSPQKNVSVKKGRTHRLRRVFLIALSVIFLLFVAANIIIHSSGFRSLVLKRANQFLQTSYGISLDVDSYRYNLWRLSLSARGIHLRSSEESTVPFEDVKIDSLEISITPSLLFGGTPHVRRLLISNPRIVVKLPAEHSGSPAPPPISPETIPLSFLLDHLQLEGGRLMLDGGEAGFSVDLTKISLSVSRPGPAFRHRLFLESGEGTVSSADFSSQVLGLSCLLFFDMRSADIERLLLKTDVATLEVKGRVEDLFSSPHFDLNVDGAVHLAKLSDFLDPEKSSEGDVRIKGMIESREDLPDFRGQISGDHLKIRGVPLDKIDALFSMDSASAELEKLELLFAGGRLTAEGKTPLPLSRGARFSVKWKDMNLAELLRMSGSDSLPVTGRSDGMLQAELQGSDLKSLTGEGEIFFQKSSIQKREALEGHLRFSRKEDGIRLFPSRLHWQGMEYSASGFLSGGGDLSGSIEVVLKDLSGLPDVLQSLNPELLKDVPLEKVSGSLVLTGTIEGTDKSPRASVELRGRGLSVEGLDVPSLDLRAEIGRGRLTVSSFKAILMEGSLEGNGWIPFNPTDFSFGGKGRLTLEMQNLDLASLQGFLPSNTLEGLVSAKLNASGTLENPRLNYNLRLSGGRFDDYALDAAGLEGRLEDGVLLIKELSLSLGENRVEGWLEAELKKGGLIRGGIKAPSFHLEPWLNMGTYGNPVVLSAQIGLDGRFTDEWDKGLENVELDFHVNQLDLRSGEWLLSASASSVIGLHAGRLETDDLLFTAPGSTLRFSGDVPLIPGPDGSLSAVLSADLKAFGSILPEAVIQGNLKMEASFTGPLERPSVNGSIELKEGRFEYPGVPVTLSGGRLQTEFQNNILILKELEGDIAGGNLSMSGRWDLAPLIRPQQKTGDTPGADNELNLYLKGLDLSFLSALLPDLSEESITGVLDAGFHLGGNVSSFPSLHGEGVIDRLTLGMSEFTVNNPERIDLELKDGILKIENFRLAGDGIDLGIKGLVNFQKEAEMKGDILAVLDLAVLSPQVPDADFGGLLKLNLSAEGPLTLPQLSGAVVLEDGFFQSEALMMLGTDFYGDIRFTGDGMEIRSFDGLVNGGSVNLSGSVLFSGLVIDEADIRLKGEQIQLMVPNGFSALAGGSLLLKSRAGRTALSGDLHLDQAFYTDDFYPGGQIWAGLKRRPVSSLSDIPPFMREILLNIGVTTGTDPLIIDNNLADLELEADIRVNGTPVEPLFSGYIRNHAEGSVSFGNRTYEVESLLLTFDRSLLPDSVINLKARTSVKHDYDNLDVTLSLDGTLTNLNLFLSSSPPRSNTELASLLITGYGTERLQSDTANVLGDQLLLYFASPLASPLTNRIKNLLGAEEVTLEPINIATEEDPGARFTFRKGLAKNIDLVYSIDIGNTQEKTWLINYDLNRNFSLSAFRRDNGEFGGSLSHRFKPLELFKKKKRPEDGRQKRTVGSLNFTGDSPLPESRLLKKMAGIKKGAIFNYGEFRRTVDVLTWELKKSGYPTAVIYPVVKNSPDGKVAISLDIRSGEAADVRFDGDSLPKSWEKEVVREWNGRLPVRIGMTIARRHLLTRLQKRGYYEAEVSVESVDAPDRKIFVFQIRKGIKYSIGNIRVEGPTSLSISRLKSILKGIPGSSGHPGWALLQDFTRSRMRLEDDLAERGFLHPKIRLTGVSSDPITRKLDINLSITDGQKSRVESRRMTGNTIFSENELIKDLSLVPGSVFRPTALAEDNNRLLNLYRKKGFQDATVILDMDFTNNGDVLLTYRIKEGEQYHIGDIDVRGISRSSERLIRRELRFKVGDPVNMERLLLSQIKLKELNIFKSIHIFREEMEGEGAVDRIVVSVEEESPLTVGYGLRYNSEEKLEGFARLDLTNLFGGGNNGLFYYRKNERQEDIRFSLKSPYLLGIRFNTLHSFYYNEDLRSVFKSEEIGYTVQQNIRLPLDFTLSYLYKLNQVHTFELVQLGPFPFDIKLFLSELQAYIVRDMRSDKLNPARGSFLSLSFSYSPEFLGTDLKYYSFFGQYSHFVPVISGIVWAVNFRLGLADAYDQYLIPNRRFFTGGGNSLRGFKRDLVGPIDPYFKDAVGGEALFVMNQELRVPILKWMDGVVFYDAGNVYLNLEDFSLRQLRHGAGFGLRLNTPVAFLRLDYGFNLNPREGEARGVFYFTIGQLF